MPSRVLIVDDTAIYRTAIANCLRDLPQFAIVGSANDGASALARIQEWQPDLVTLDLEMPGIDGLGVLRALRQHPPAHPPRIIVFSAHSQQGATVSMEALRLGAIDFAVKPTASQGLRGIADQLLPKLLALSNPSPRQPSTAREAIDPQTRRRLLVIASSTGGPQALEAALSALPASLAVPILIVQHMPALFTRTLAERLNACSGLHISEASSGDPLQPGHAYLAPGDWHMQVVRDGAHYRIALDQGPKITGLRPAVDVLLESLAPLFPGQILLAVFTGMGRDGEAGMRRLAVDGSTCISQSRESCVVYGMPMAVDEAGFACDHFTPATFLRCLRKHQLRW